MKNEKFITPNKELNEYIESLEAKLALFGASNARRLIASIDKMAGKISDAIDDVIDDAVENTDIQRTDEADIKTELPSKLVETFIKMIDKIDKIKNLIEVTETIFNLVKDPSEIVSNKPEAEGNMFEQTQKKIKVGVTNGTT